MATTTVEPDDATILLLFQRDRDRSLLAEWLESFPHYSVTTTLDDTETPTYDIALLDLPSFTQHYDRIDTHVQAVNPVFLPVMVVGSQHDDPVTRADLPADADALIDDFLSMPVEQPALRRRVDNLLKTRHASIKLAAREHQYRSLVELTPEAILLLHDDEIVYANTAARDLFGDDTTDDLESRSLLAFVPASTRSDVDELLTQIETTGSLDDYTTCQFESLAGEEIVGSLAGVRITYEGDPTTQLLIRDVTDEQARKERLSLFGRAIDAAAQGITIADAQADDEPLIYANDAFERITGYSAAEILGENCRFLQGPNTDDDTVARIAQAIDGGDPVAVEILNYRKDGTPFWNQLEIVPITGEDGAVTHFLGLQQDITERKNREEQLQVLNRVLRHNIRNRVNVIEGYAEQVADPDVAERIKNASRALLQISNRFQEFRRFATEERDQREVLDLSGELDKVITGLRETYSEATIEYECPADVVVWGHPFLLSALSEVIELGLLADGTTALGVEVERENGQVGLTVYDYGEAIPSEELAAAASGVESAVEHPRGIELWLLRWGVMHAGGDFAVELAGDPPTIEVWLPEAAGSETA